MSRTKIGIGAIGAIALAAVLAVAGFATLRNANAFGVPTQNTYVIDADANTAGIQASINVPVGGTFDFVPTITQAPDSYQSYQSNVSFNAAIIGYVSGPVESGGAGLGAASLCAPGTVGVNNIFGGCARVSGTQNNTGPTEIWHFQCLAPGSSPLHLQTDAEIGEATGTNFGNTNGVAGASGEGPTVDATVNCVLGVNKTDNLGGNPAIAGGTVTYSITVNNPLGNAGDSFTGVIVDTVPTNGTASFSYAGDSLGNSCDAVSTPGVVTCITNFVNPSTTVQITFNVPLSAAGANNVCDSATTYDLSANQTGAVSTDCVNVAAAHLTVTKAVVGGPNFQAGDPISWTITVKSDGLSPAAGVSYTDTPNIGDAAGTGWNATDPLTGSLGTMAPGSQQVITINGNVTDPQPADNTCNNAVAVTSTNGATGSASASAGCLSKNVRMVKSTDCANAPQNSGENANLFLDNGGSKANPLQSLTICEWALNVGADPQGVGAFEFDVSYDNRVFDIAVAGTSWLYDTGRVADASNSTDPAVGCAATVITENDVRFGCVSKNPQPLAGPAQCLGPDDVTEVVGAVCGNKADGVIATITVTPKADLLSRITPGNDNGVIRTLVDSGCEYADIWGHPLETLGNGSVLPGIQPGGQVTDCSNLTVTVRILEGDMNTDCTVDVTDDQMEASHYGSTFGSLLYDPWYDLEPALKDGDVDIKDLQKVFGRNGSDCASPVPPQPAQPQPGDP